MITENAIIKAGIATATLSLAGTDALTRHLPLFTDEHELTTILWLIGGMLSILVLLMSAICWFVRDMRNSNKAQHTLLFSGHNELAQDFADLLGQHKAAFNAQGCAYDSERLQNMITDSIIVAMNEMGDNKFVECPHYDKVGGD